MSQYTKRYNPDRHKDWNYGGSKWKLSRSKIELYIECPRCFYLDNKLGTKRPSFPSFNLNNAVDELFKREFDVYRTKKEPHPLMTKYGIEAIPFEHKDLDTWRDSFVGITHHHDETGLTISGGVDDVWIDSQDKLIVVDYKATSKDGSIETLSDSPWETQYRRQMGVYQWLLHKNNFSVSSTGYFVYANADQSREEFANILHFETTVLPCEGELSWIDKLLPEIKNCLESSMYPDSSPDCEYCLYRQSCGKKLQSIYADNKK